MKRLRMRHGHVWLQAKNPACPNIPITEGIEFEIWGVVRRSVRMLAP